MKICRFIHEEKTLCGYIDENLIYPLDNFFDLEFTKIKKNRALFIKAEKVKFVAPVTPSKIVCVGRNYAEHAAELGNEVPKEPLLFLKAPSAVISNNEKIFLPIQSNKVEHEGELAVVIGRDCKNLNVEQNPFEYVLGYTCLNDVTARDLQKQDKQFARAKSFDTFCPIGTFIETDLDVSDIRITTKVNNIIKQDGRTSQMIFPVDYLVRYISNQMTLKKGDIIATGTPAGVSQLNAGDVCEIEIEGVGILRNSVGQ